MGTSHSQIHNDDLFKSFHKLQWTKLTDQGMYQLWSNANTSQLCEAYKLDYVPKEEDLEHYRFRHYKQTADNFVEIRYIDIQQNPTLCYHGQTYVLTEFIPVKLAEMHDLSHNEGYSILRSSYRAFHTMQAFHGPFIPNEDLIGINMNGKPKIWLNKNHSRNKADSVIKAQIWQKHVGEVSQNVRRIFQMVEQRVTGKRFPTEFRNFIYDNIMNFAQASQFVEDYCEQHRITIPSTIQYTQFVEDPQLTKIINQYNLKRQSSTLNDKLNTMESTYEHERIGKESVVRELKRTDSHQQFGYRENVHFVRPQQTFSFVTSNQPTNIATVKKNAFSPVIQRASAAHIIIAPRSQIVHNFNQQSRVSGPQITIPSQTNLRSTVSVMQIQPIIQPIPRQVPLEAPKVILYQNLKTPAHVTGNFAIVPPNKITEFELPVRKHSDNVQSVKSGSIPQSANQKTESIHEKIKDLEDELDYFNESVPGENEFVEETKGQPHQQEFQKYINDNSQMYPQRSEEFEQNVTSEPDWQNMQTQNQHYQTRNYNQNHEYHQQENHDHHQYEEYRYEPQQYDVNLEIDNAGQVYQMNYHQEQEIKQDDISPIKENPVKNTQEFENHYAMFTKYAQLNQHQPEHHHEEQEVANSSNFQPRNLDLNQSVTMSDQDQENGSANQNEQNEISATQPHQISGLESLEQIHRNSSKNTSINKDSSGTLVVHQSKQNIYNEISNDERNYKVRQQSIQQNSLQSQNQEGLDENYARKQMMNQLLMDNSEPDEAIQQRDFQQVPVRNLELNQNEYDWRNEPDHYDEVRQSGQFEDPNEETPRIEEHPQTTNQYSNLHFRNESDELYQYTPVESVYRTETAKHTFPTLSRPSGVEDLVQLERHQDIEEYIRQKYSGMIHGSQVPKNNPKPKPRSPKNYNNNRAMTFAKPLEPQSREQKQIQTREYQENLPPQQNRFEVNKIQSLYQRIDHYDSHITTQVQRSDVQPPPETNDFLDVGNLEKSLDRKYKQHSEVNHVKISSPKSGHNVRGSQTMSEQDGMNVAALEQRLLKFEERQSIEREKSQRKIQAQNDEPFKSNNDLNFNELDNIVELMDKKIQQSQKKQQNKSSQEVKSHSQVSEFNPGKQSKVDQLENVELETSINNLHNKEISLKDIPILAKDRASNASNSRQASKRDYYNKYGIDSEDFASGRGSSSNDYGIGKDSYSFNKRQSRNYDSKKVEILSPVIEIDRKYENYSSKNISSHTYDMPSLNVSPLSTSQVQRRSSRRSSKQVEQAKLLVEKISSKYDQYMSSETSSNYDIDKPFAKKSYTNIVDTYDNNQNQNYSSNGSSRYISSSSKYINEEPKKVSKGSRVSARDMERKRSSYLNPIEELNCENYASPLKESTPYNNQENYLKLSNQNSRAPSGRNFENKSRKSSAKVSYDELRDLLWK